MGPRHHVLDGVQIPNGKGHFCGGGDSAVSQIRFVKLLRSLVCYSLLFGKGITLLFFWGGGIPQLSIRDGLLWMNGVRCSVWLRGRGGVAGLGGRAFRRPSAGPLQSHARHVAPHVPRLALGRQLRQLHRHRSVTVAYHSPLVAAIRPSVRLLACRMPLVQKHCIAGL